MSRLSSSISSQLSGNIRQNYPRFVEFLTAYYEWLEQPDNPYYHIRNHLSFLDFEKSLETYVDQMKKEYLVNIPERILGNPELFIKYSKQFNISIGSAKSFNFVFNMLYGEDVEVYYPKNDILRGSDGKWVSDEYKLYITSEYDPELFLNRKIVQKQEVAGFVSYATGTVLRVKQRFINRYKFTEIVITDLEGDFDPTLPVYPDNNESKREWFMPVGVNYTINDGGTNYRQGDLVRLTTTDQYIIQRNSQFNGRFDTRVTTDFNKEDIEVYVEGTQLTLGEYSFDGRIINSPVITIDDSVEVRMPIYAGFIIVDNVGGTIGNIESINIIEPPIGINGSPYTLDTTEGGSGADIELVSGTELKIPGYYRNDDGHLSSTKVLQDGDFYQEYSYVIKSSQAINSYRDVVLDVLHPAGMKLFGQINIKYLINLMIRNIDFDINVKPPVLQFVSDDTVSLGPTTSFIDRNKYGFDEELVVAENYFDVVTGDVIDTPTKRFNAGDMEYVYVCEDVYIESGYYDSGYICQGINDYPNCVDEFTEEGYYTFGYICDEAFL